MSKELKAKDFFLNSASLDLFHITNHIFFLQWKILKTAEFCCFVCHFLKLKIHLRNRQSIIIVFGEGFLFFYFANFFSSLIQQKSKAEKNKHQLNWPNSCLSSLKTTFISHYSIALANFCSVRAAFWPLNLANEKKVFTLYKKFRLLRELRHSILMVDWWYRPCMNQINWQVSTRRLRSNNLWKMRY